MDENEIFCSHNLVRRFPELAKRGIQKFDKLYTEVNNKAIEISLTDAYFQFTLQDSDLVNFRRGGNCNLSSSNDSNIFQYLENLFDQICDPRFRLAFISVCKRLCNSVPTDDDVKPFVFAFISQYRTDAPIIIDQFFYFMTLSFQKDIPGPSWRIVWSSVALTKTCPVFELLPCTIKTQICFDRKHNGTSLFSKLPVDVIKMVFSYAERTPIRPPSS